jgi:hypothetical protein
MTKFEQQAMFYKSLVTDVLASAESEYAFISRTAFRLLIEQGRFQEANQIYVREIIARFHAAALITLRRNLEWLTSLEATNADSKLLGFCVSLRGVIESSADSFFSLQYVPQNIARNYALVRSCLHGNVATGMHTFKELEDWGLHFLQAGKYDDKSLPEEHYKAKQPWEYINAIDSNPFFGKVYPLYQKLCQFTHPSRETAYLFFTEIEEYKWRVGPYDYATMHGELLTMPEVDYDAILQSSFNSALLILWLIDRLEEEGMRCPKIREVSFESMAHFADIQQWLDASEMEHRKQ